MHKMKITEEDLYELLDIEFTSTINDVSYATIK